MSEKIKKKYAVGYIRVSTEEQAGDDRFGIEAQKQAILAWTEANGYEIVKWYIDRISGTAENRPELNNLLSGDEVVNPPFEAVIAFKSDRVARDIKLYFYYLFVLEKRNIKLISTQEDFDGTFGDVYRALILFVAEQERKNIALRTSSGRRVKASAGGYSGGRCPYGYKVVDGRLIIVPEEAEMVRIIFKEREEGKTLQEISEDLDDMGYRTRKGRRFLFSSIRDILSHERLYRGEYSYGSKDPEGNKIYVKGVHEPILTNNEGGIE